MTEIQAKYAEAEATYDAACDHAFTLAGEVYGNARKIARVALNITIKELEAALVAQEQETDQ